MKKIFALVMMAISLAGTTVVAELPITRVDKINPTDEVFMDMALTAAKKGKSEGQKAAGAVVILNGAWKGTGTATGDTTAEENAIIKSRLSNLRNADIYTINEPTTEAYNVICRMGARGVYFVNPRQDVVAAGIYPAEAYDDAKIDTTYTAVPMSCMAFPGAAAFIK